MSAPIRIILTSEQEIILSETREAENLPQRTRDRAHMVRMNAQGWNVPKIAQIFKCHEHTVRTTLKRWQIGGIDGLSEMKGRGAKPKWQNSDLEYLSDCLENDPRTYNCKQLAHKLKQERGVDLSSDRLRRVLKKKGYRWKRTRASHKAKQDPVKKAIKQADLEMLILAAAVGEIDLKYLDESGFCLESPVSYSYSQIGEQKRMEQPLKKYGKRVSILGLWQPEQSFEYALAQGGFNSQSYIKFMDWVAHRASLTLAETGRITGAIKDNGSLHTSILSQQQWTRWQEQGLYIFFLPPYCSEMNLIECEWHQLKNHEISGQMFDNEYDLALAIISGMNSRSSDGGYAIKRFIFNCA